ncbi:MAG TPA: hypothetical protein VJ826_02375 [Candidatus Polarisedimenticolaceae bacterium]|nr:hypothetical protein [Candidatus Polarisedimenticolaceae bacterium]
MTTTHDVSLTAAYDAHPLLDPNLPSRHPALTRLWVDSYRRMLRDPELFDRIVRGYVLPAGSRTSEAVDLGRYFHDADAYVNDILRLLPEPLARHLAPLPETRGGSTIRDLLRATFDAPHPRSRYEAQRKLYLAKLLFDIDHSRSVRDGPKHRARFEQILHDTLWRDVVEEDEVEAYGVLEPDTKGGLRLRLGREPRTGAHAFRFRPRMLAAEPGEPAIEIFHWRARFKREADPATGRSGPDGWLKIAEAPRWPGLGGMSGSILSKMIRRAIPDPRMVQDLLGAMFIVGDRRQAYALERRMVAAFGGPLRWRDRVDTLRGQRDRARLDPQSSSGFLVLKEIVDILTGDPSSDVPYLFSVEIQIFPLEAYLETLYDAHFASHAAYKRRQFLHELLPILFPATIYGVDGGDIDRATRSGV